jgi:hypothetical protein
MMGCPDNPFKICKAKPMPPPEECPEDPEKVPNRHIGPCCRLGPGYLSAYGVNAKTDFRIIYRAKNLTYEVLTLTIKIYFCYALLPSDTYVKMLYPQTSFLCILVAGHISV